MTDSTFSMCEFTTASFLVFMYDRDGQYTVRTMNEVLGNHVFMESNRSANVSNLASAFHIWTQ
jgi:hypothetical protein